MENLCERIAVYKNKKSTHIIKTRTIMSGKVMSGDIITVKGKTVIVDNIRYSKKTKRFFFYCAEPSQEAFPFKQIGIRIIIHKHRSVLVTQIINR